MKKIAVIFAFTVVLILITACSPKALKETVTLTKALLPTETLPSSIAKTAKPTDIPPTQTATYTLEPTATATPAATATPNYEFVDRNQAIFLSFNHELVLVSMDDYTQKILDRNINLGSSHLFWGVSPDGSKILYALDDYKKGKIMDLESGETVDLPFSPYMYAWTSDGSRLLMRFDTEIEGTPWGVALFNPATGDLISEISNTNFWDFAFLPDDRLLVSDLNSLYIHNPIYDGNEILEGIEETTYTVISPSIGNRSIDVIKVSPDGQKVAFLGTDRAFPYSDADIYVINMDGSGLINLTNGKITLNKTRIIQDELTWSPDGSKIGFWAMHYHAQDESGGSLDQPQVFVANSDGSGIVEITDAQFPEGQSSTWSPDGSKLLFLAGTSRFDTSQMVICNPDGSEKFLVPGITWINNAAYRPALKFETSNIGVDQTFVDATPPSTLTAGALLVPTATPKPSTSTGSASWKSLPPASGLPVRGMQAVYDNSRNVVVLFGGTDSANKFLNQTWEFDGKTWKQINTSHSPAPRLWFGMAYDAKHKVVVLFGGRANDSGTLLEDTWEYDGKDWTRIDTTSPGKRGDGSGMVYDTCRNKIILFGGSSAVGPTDTWEYDGTAWSKVKTLKSPSAHSLTAMVFDSNRCKAVLFGGGKDGKVLNDTWEYDGSNWENVTTTQTPAGRWGHAMAYNPISGHVILFGGFANNALLKDTWIYDGADWRKISTPRAPSAREQHAMVFSWNTGQILMIGGYGSNGNWAFAEGVLQSATPTATTTSSSCAGGWTRLSIGRYASVTSDNSTSNHVRSEPKMTDNIIGSLGPGMVVKILDGPVCADGLVFWKVGNSTITGGEGWTAEGDGINYFLEPLK